MLNLEELKTEELKNLWNEFVEAEYSECDDDYRIFNNDSSMNCEFYQYSPRELARIFGNSEYDYVDPYWSLNDDWLAVSFRNIHRFVLSHEKYRNFKKWLAEKK